MRSRMLRKLLRKVRQGDDQERLFKNVRKLVYGDMGWDSPYRIDNFEFSENILYLKVSDRMLDSVFTYKKCFREVQYLRLVA